MEKMDEEFNDKFPTWDSKYKWAESARPDEILEYFKSFLLASNARIRLQTLQEVQGMIEGEVEKKVGEFMKMYLDDDFCYEDGEFSFQLVVNHLRTALSALAAKLSALTEQEK